MNDFGLDLAVIGNGRTAALADPSSRIVWWCYPRFDGDPIFSRLVAGGEEKGFRDVVLDGMVEFSSDYVRNTAIVSTVLTNDKGASVRITDFAPRFREYDRIFRPGQLVRIIEPIADQAWNEKRGAFTAAIGIDDLDASVLLLPEIGLMETRDRRNAQEPHQRVGLRARDVAALAFLAGDLAGARFAAVLIYHCRSAEEARALWSALGDRLAACKLVLHPVKTKVVSHLLARSAPRIC
jgi:hypothetical protein